MATTRLLVVGGGTAGLGAARAARSAGARVTLVADGPIGGDCTWTGCVPSKALIEAAAAGDGYAAARRHLLDTRAAIAATEDEQALTEEGVDVVRGRARLVAPTRALVRLPDGAETEVAGDRALVATGSSPLVPPVAGLGDVDPLTNETVFDLAELPGSLAVLGGGTVGCELAQVMARFGVDVTLVEAAGRLLPAEEPLASTVVTEAMRRDGVTVRTATSVRSARRDGPAVVLDVAGGAAAVRAERVLVAAGRVPSGAGLGLEALGVGVRGGAVQVDTRLRTAAAAVYAAGDVTGVLPLTHVADAMGRQAAANALGTRRRGTYSTRAVPWVTFTDPEVARVGLTTEQARGTGARVAQLPMAEVDRGRLARRTEGFVTLVAGRRGLLGHAGGGRLVGATIVGPRAGEMVGELALLAHLDAFVGRLAQVQHAYPSWSVALAQATAQLFGTYGGRTAERI